LLSDSLSAVGFVSLKLEVPNKLYKIIYQKKKVLTDLPVSAGAFTHSV